MKRRSVVVVVALAMSGTGAAFGGFVGCSSSSNPTGAAEADGSAEAATTLPGEAGAEAGVDGAVAPIDSSTSVDGATDAGPDAHDAGPAVLTGMAIVSQYGTPLGGVPGDAIPLKVVFTWSDGTTTDLPPGTPVAWTSPQTVVAQNPYDAGPTSTLPPFGAQPTAIFVANPSRPERMDYPGVLFVLDRGTGSDAGVGVTAQLVDGGTISAVVPVGAAPVGDPDAGAHLFAATLNCAGCHGDHGAGTPAEVLADGGLDLDDAGDPLYMILGGTYLYPAAGLNAANPEGGAPNVAADPAWNAALLGMAAQSDMDNNGVALRFPMPDWLGKPNAAGQQLSGKDFADIYAWLQTQTQTP